MDSKKASLIPEMGPEGEFERKRLNRLIKLQTADAGFFLLATHSYIESWLRQKLHLWDERISFSDLLFRFKISLIEDAGTFPDGLNVLQVLRTKDRTAVAVRQNYIEISNEESAGAAYRLLQFCSLAHIRQTEELEQIRDMLRSWEDRSLTADDELTFLKQKIAASRRRNVNLLAEIEQLRRYRVEAEVFSRKVSELQAEIGRLKKQNFGGQADELVKQMANTEKSRQEKNNQISELRSADEYVTDLGRLTSYTITRGDFERDVTRLTPEQQDILDGISLRGDFLIKGGAGTGKTLVLIKSVEKALQLDENELNFSDSRTSVKLLTFNRTLAKYDRYLAEVSGAKNEIERITTVDKFLYDRLRLINDEYKIIYSDTWAEDLVSGLNSTDKHDDRRLAHEIENIIFGGNLSEAEYLNSGSSGRGEREEIWKIRNLFIDRMEDSGSFTKNYSRLKIMDYLSDKPDEARLRDTDFIFIDEVQDLSIADVRCIKACARRAVIMAGDSDQSIYQSGFTFARGGIDIRGSVKILKTNFRNTAEIHELAESYREKSGRAEACSGTKAFRSGPPPELYRGTDYDELISLIAKRAALYISDIHYDPENICILVPSSKDILPLQAALHETGFDGKDLRTDDFEFTEKNVIRISTMHSSKGLDFPVVLLFLHKLPQTSFSESREASEKMRRNLIYVSMTRAMDQLNVFVMKKENRGEITDLIDIF